MREFLDCPKCKKPAIPEDHVTSEERSIWLVGSQHVCSHCGVNLIVDSDGGGVLATVVDAALAASMARVQQNESEDRDRDLLAKLRAHPQAADVLDWIDRNSALWESRPQYAAGREVVGLLLKLVRGES